MRGCVRHDAQAARGDQFRESAETRRAREHFDAWTGILAGLQHFRGRLAFRKRELLIDDQRAAQRHREEHAEHAAETRDRQHPRIFEVVPVAEDHQRRNGKDHTRRDRGACGSAGLHDVVLENVPAAEHSQHRHRNDRCRNGGRDRQTREQAKVRIRSGKDHRKDDRENDGARRELGSGSRCHC